MPITDKNKDIDWHAVLHKLEADTQRQSSRIARGLFSPLKYLKVLKLRRSGISKPLICPLGWGDEFLGHIPESVTSVIWRTGWYENSTTKFVMKNLKPGDTFVDIGSHFGYFTLLASRLVGLSGKVVAIEAMPSTFSQLKQNIDHNKITNVEIYNYAAYNTVDELTFKDFGIVHSSLNTAFDVRGVLEDAVANYTEANIQALPGDDLLKKHSDNNIAMIKIDAESSEEFVLEGLSDTLKKHHPTIVLELGGSKSDVQRAKVISEILIKHGHKPFRLVQGDLVLVNIDGNIPYDNYIFRHPSRD